MTGNIRLTSGELAAYIDHTNLKPDATDRSIVRLCEEAVHYSFYSVCVGGMWVKRCGDLLRDSAVKISAVCGFPLGTTNTAALAAETAQAITDGAAEIDMVLPIGALLDNDTATVERHIAAVVHAADHRALVKVILETGYLSDDQKRLACRIAESAGAHYVKTSTGFGPGGATVNDIRLMRSCVSASVGVKASGGVRDYAAALAMIQAGATRIGTSSGPAIVEGAASGQSGDIT